MHTAAIIIGLALVLLFAFLFATALEVYWKAWSQLRARGIRERPPMDAEFIQVLRWYVVWLVIGLALTAWGLFF